MNHYYQIVTLVILSFSCSDATTEYQDLGTPDLAEMVYSEIELLNKQHIILFFNSENETYNLKDLKTELLQLIRFDIDSTSLNQFLQSQSHCDGLHQKIWSSDNFTLTYLSYEVKSQKNEIELMKINIDSDNDKVELLTVSGQPLEYLIINDRKYVPTYESRIIGLDEAIEEFFKKTAHSLKGWVCEV